MTIYVDELKGHPQRASTAQARRHFGEGRQSCHLFTDGTEEELHAFAQGIGLRREWFQPHRVKAHYDLTARRRAAAVAAGATEVILREYLKQRTETKIVRRHVPAELPPVADAAPVVDATATAATSPRRIMQLALALDPAATLSGRRS